MTFSTLEQRIAHSYLDMFPPFAPLETAAVAVESQAHFYGFMARVYQTIFDFALIYWMKPAIQSKLT